MYLSPEWRASSGGPVYTSHQSCRHRSSPARPFAPAATGALAATTRGGACAQGGSQGRTARRRRGGAVAESASVAKPASLPERAAITEHTDIIERGGAAERAADAERAAAATPPGAAGAATPEHGRSDAVRGGRLTPQGRGRSGGRRARVDVMILRARTGGLAAQRPHVASTRKRKLLTRCKPRRRARRGSACERDVGYGFTGRWGTALGLRRSNDRNSLCALWCKTHSSR